MIINNTSIIGLIEPFSLKNIASSNIYIENKNYEITLSTIPSSIYEITLASIINSQRTINTRDSIINSIGITISIKIIYMEKFTDAALIIENKIPFIFNINDFCNIDIANVLDFNFNVSDNNLYFSILFVFIKNTSDLLIDDIHNKNIKVIEKVPTYFDSTFDYI